MESSARTKLVHYQNFSRPYDAWMCGTCLLTGNSPSLTKNDCSVSAFAGFGDTLRPKSFAGLFGAAPSIAPAGADAPACCSNAGDGIDKTRYSAFAGPRLLAHLRQRGADALIVSGSETDVCVLATVLSAVDMGTV